MYKKLWNKVAKVSLKKENEIGGLTKFADSKVFVQMKKTIFVL